MHKILLREHCNSYLGSMNFTRASNLCWIWSLFFWKIRDIGGVFLLVSILSTYLIIFYLRGKTRLDARAVASLARLAASDAGAAPLALQPCFPDLRTPFIKLLLIACSCWGFGRGFCVMGCFLVLKSLVG